MHEDDTDVPTGDEDFLELDEPARPLMIGKRVVNDRTLYCISRELAIARFRSLLLQQQVARRMGTTASAISRLENAVGPRPSLTTLERYADAVDCYLDIRLIPLFTLEAFHAMARYRS